jgi:predicted esterase
MRVVSIETLTHGRVLIREAPTTSSSMRVLVGFHGYAQSAEDMMEEMERVAGAQSWTLLSVQGLHRFYSRRQDKVVASWMTREDRESAIADNIAYVDRAIGGIAGGATDVRMVYIGFSQGVAMAYRAAVAGAYRPLGIIAVGGDVPPDVRTAPKERFPSVLIAAGDNDEWYTSARVAEDESALHSIGARFEVFRYHGGHEFTPALHDRIHLVLESLA